jgi:integrase
VAEHQGAIKEIRTLLYLWHVWCYRAGVASIRKLPSGHYRVRWRDAAGDEHGETAPTKKAALALKAQVEVDAFHGVHHDPKKGRQAFGPYLLDMLDSSTDLRPATLALYRTSAQRYVVPRIGGKAIRTIDTADLRRLYADLVRHGVGVPTVEVVHRLVSRTMAQAVDDGLVSANPAARAKAPRAQREPIRVMSTAEAIWLAWVLQHHEDLNRGSREQREIGRKSFLDGLGDLFLGKGHSDEERLDFFARYPGYPGSDGYGVMALVAMFAGLRFGEVAALRVSHVTLGPQPKLRVEQAASEVRGVVEIGPTKTKGSRRTVPIRRRVAGILTKHIDEGLLARGYHLNDSMGPDEEARRVLGPDPLLFTTHTGLPLPRTRFALRIWRPAVALAALDPAPSFHDLRHSYAAWLIERGVHPKVIQERLGHSSIRTTMDIYGSLMEGLDEADDLDDDVDGGTPVARRRQSLHAVEAR